MMAQRLFDRSSVPDLIFASSATRALMTAEHLMNCFQNEKTTLKVDEQLYLASPFTILTLLKHIDHDIQHVLVVAHNPGLEDLSAQLINEASTHMPTAAIRQFACPAWSELGNCERRRHSDLIGSQDKSTGPGAFRLIHSDQPKN